MSTKVEDALISIISLSLRLSSPSRPWRLSPAWDVRLTARHLVLTGVLRNPKIQKKSTEEKYVCVGGATYSMLSHFQVAFFFFNPVYSSFKKKKNQASCTMKRPIAKREAGGANSWVVWLLCGFAFPFLFLCRKCSDWVSAEPQQRFHPGAERARTVVQEHWWVDMQGPGECFYHGRCYF